MTKPQLLEFLGMTLGVLGLGVACFAIYLGTRNERRKRELEHQERMRALELGRPLPGGGPWLTPLRTGLLIALAVPVVALAIAAKATEASGYHPEIWQAAGMVGVAAVIGGSVIIGLSLSRSAEGPAALASESKPHVEEDAYDVVSARG